MDSKHDDGMPSSPSADRQRSSSKHRPKAIKSKGLPKGASNGGHSSSAPSTPRGKRGHATFDPRKATARTQAIVRLLSSVAGPEPAPHDEKGADEKGAPRLHRPTTAPHALTADDVDFLLAEHKKGAVAFLRSGTMDITATVPNSRHFLFECPFCREVLQVGYTARWFRCASCSNAYKVRHEHDPEAVDAEVKEAEEQLLLPVVGDPLPIISAIGGHAPSDEKVPELPKVPSAARAPSPVRIRSVDVDPAGDAVPRGDDRRNVYESVGAPDGLDPSVYLAVRQMFLKNDPFYTGKVKVRTLLKTVDRFLYGKVLRMATSVLDKNADMFGPTFPMRFTQFLNELARYLGLAAVHEQQSSVRGVGKNILSK